MTKTSYQKICYQGVVVILLLVFLSLFRFESSIIDTLANYAGIGILSIGIMDITFWLHHRNSQSFGSDVNSIYKFWMIMLLYFFSIPLFDSKFNFNIGTFYQGVFHDYKYLLFATLPFLFITDSSKIYYDKIFKNVGYVALAAGCIAILISDKSLSNVASRKETFTLTYFLWWIVLMVFPYLFLNFYYRKKFKVGYYLIIIHFILSFLFLKRAGFLNGILVVFFALIFSKQRSKIGIALLFLILLVFFASLLFNDYIDLLMSRFTKDSTNLEEWDRNTEAEEFFNKVSFAQLITGFGANNYIKMYYVGVYDKAVNALHIGAYDTIYKGGVLYVLFKLYVGIKIISLYKYIKHSIEIKIGFIIGIIFIISHFYEQSWSYLPTIFFTLLPIYRAIYVKDKMVLNRKVKGNLNKTFNRT